MENVFSVVADMGHKIVLELSMNRIDALQGDNTVVADTPTLRRLVAEIRSLRIATEEAARKAWEACSFLTGQMASVEAVAAATARNAGNEAVALRADAAKEALERLNSVLLNALQASQPQPQPQQPTQPAAEAAPAAADVGVEAVADLPADPAATDPAENAGTQAAQVDPVIADPADLEAELSGLPKAQTAPADGSTL